MRFVAGGVPVLRRLVEFGAALDPGKHKLEPDVMHNPVIILETASIGYAREGRRAEGG